MIATLQWLGIIPSFSRPHASNDNPYSEALFRTLKHTPAYPRLPFTSRDAGRQWVERFVALAQHRAPSQRPSVCHARQRHAGAHVAILVRRRVLYERAQRRTPERWSGQTRNWTPIDTVVLNPQPAATRLDAKS